MSGLVSRIRSLWRGVRRRRDVESEMLEEFRHHIELRARDLEREGLSPNDAMRRARLEFGHVESHRESARASRGLHWFDEIGFSWLDVKLGLRMIRKYPGLTAVSVIGMAVAIAIGAGFFGFIQALVDPTLPDAGGDRVVGIQNATDNPVNPDFRVLHDFLLWREGATAISDMGAFRRVQRNVITAAGAAPVTIAEMSAAGFRVLGAVPLLGRPLLEEDERLGGPAVIVIGEEVWRQRFAADPDIVGRRIRVGAELHTIVGVMPSRFRFPVDDRYWVPLRLDASDYPIGGGPHLTVFGRLRDGATMERAQAELSTLGARMAAEYPESHARLRPQILAYPRAYFDINGSPLHRWGLRLAQVGVSLLLAVVAVNVAMLVYARTATRIGEIAVRSALGASRWRILAQLFVEAFLVSLVAAGIGVALAGIALEQVQAFQERLGRGLPYWIRLGLSPGLATYAAALALMAGVIAGVLPALKVTGRRVQAGLQHLSGRGSRMQLGRTWTAMIVAQVALSVAILPFAVYVAARSIERSVAQPAFPTTEVLYASLSIERDDAGPSGHPGRPAAHDARATSDSAIDARFVVRADALLRRLQVEPGVAGVAFAWRPIDTGSYERFEIENGPTITMMTNAVDVDAFEVIGVSVANGRGFAPADATVAPHTALVTRELAERLGAPVIGRRLRTVQGEGRDGPIEHGPWLEIVGTVPDFAVAYDFEPQPPRIYTPLSLARSAPRARAGNIALMLRVRGGSAPAFGRRLAAIAASVDPGLQLDQVRTAAQNHRTARQSILAFAAIVVAVCGSVLLLSAAGIYALMSFTVARRRREIGIRTALGAAPRRLLVGIFARAAAQLGAGVVIGLLLAGAISRAMLGGGPSLPDALAYGPAVAAILAVVGLAAALGPARRALAVQPTEALREE